MCIGNQCTLNLTTRLYILSNVSVIPSWPSMVLPCLSYRVLTGSSVLNFRYYVPVRTFPTLVDGLQLCDIYHTIQSGGNLISRLHPLFNYELRPQGSSHAVSVICLVCHLNWAVGNRASNRRLPPQFASIKIDMYSTTLHFYHAKRPRSVPQILEVI